MKEKVRCLELGASNYLSTLRRHWVEIAWAVFSGACVAVVLALSRWETIPLHLVWVSLTLLYDHLIDPHAARSPPRTPAPHPSSP